VFCYYLLIVIIFTIITGPSELRTERSDFVRKRRDCVRIGLPDSVGRRGAYHDLISAVYDRPLHGTPRIPKPRLQTCYARNEERSSGVQSGRFLRKIKLWKRR